MAKIELFKGNITKLQVDVIVNADNQTHKDLEVGEARMSDGQNISADYVIHTIAPLWQEGNQGEIALLENCYMNSIGLAARYRFESIAFPCIGTGVYGFPKEVATKIALDVIKEFLLKASSIKKVVIVLSDEDNYQHYLKMLGEN
jgi:O-acetyl-ADP-ribose deacetylase (regulator of RNase III)